MFPAVRGPVNDLELNLKMMFLIGVMELVGLIDGSLNILIATQRQRGRIQPVDMKYGTGSSHQLGPLLRLISQEQVQLHVKESALVVSYEFASPARDRT